MIGSIKMRPGNFFFSFSSMPPQGAIEMARKALTSAKHEEIKQMARDIISAQQREIDQMNQWLRDWGYTQ